MSNHQSLSFVRKTFIAFFTLLLATNSYKVLGGEQRLAYESDVSSKDKVCERKLDYLDLEECQAEAMLENRNPEECASYYWSKSAKMEEYDSERIVLECDSEESNDAKIVTSE